MELELQTVSYGRVSVLRCRGKLVYGAETAEFERGVRQALEGTKEIVLHMGDVSRIDSGGVGALGTAFMAAHNREAQIKLAALPPRVEDVLRITGLGLLFDIRNSESEAVAAFLAGEKYEPAGLEGMIKAT